VWHTTSTLEPDGDPKAAWADIQLLATDFARFTEACQAAEPPASDADLKAATLSGADWTSSKSWRVEYPAACWGFPGVGGSLFISEAFELDFRLDSSSTSKYTLYRPY
jgi:hypothetical protein